MSKPTYAKLTAAQVASINTITRSLFGPAEQSVFLALLDKTLVDAVPPVATTSVRGTVLSGAAVTDSVAAGGTAAPAGGVGTAAGGWDTAANRDAAITTINTTLTLALDVQTKLNDLLAKLRTAGIIAP